MSPASEASPASPPARVIAFVNQKGGPGKTTLAMHVAGELARGGSRVLVADADPQATATRWAAAAPDDAPFPAAVAGLNHAGQKLHRELLKYVAPYDFIVVDCPPSAESNLTRSALLVADLAVVPVVPSPPDLWAGVAIGQVLVEVGVLNDSLESRLVVNRFKARTRLGAHTPDLLAQYGIPVLEARIGEREAFRHAAATGVTAYDLPRASQAAAEITALTEELLLVLNGDLHDQT